MTYILLQGKRDDEGGKKREEDLETKDSRLVLYLQQTHIQPVCVTCIAIVCMCVYTMCTTHCVAKRKCRKTDSRHTLLPSNVSHPVTDDTTYASILSTLSILLLYSIHSQSISLYLITWPIPSIRIMIMMPVMMSFPSTNYRPKSSIMCS